MADETNPTVNETKATVDTAAETAKAATEAAGETGKQATATARKATRTGARASKRVVEAAEKINRKTSRRAKSQRRARRQARKPEAAAANEAAANERTNDMNFDPSTFFTGFGAFPAAPFQSLFAEAGDRGQEAVRRSQQAAEELADLTRANVEALTEAGRIAAEGTRSLGQDVVETSRESIEQAADAVRSLAEAKSATEFVQLQGEFARASFDRFVSESSRLTESMVKLAGEAFQPISSRASQNAERLNQIVA